MILLAIIGRTLIYAGIAIILLIGSFVWSLTQIGDGGTDLGTGSLVLLVSGALLLLTSPIIATLHTLVKRGRASAKLKKQQAEKDKWEVLLREQVVLHEAVLRRNMERAVRRNDYGAVVEDTTYKVVSEFLQSVGHSHSPLSIDEAEFVIKEKLANVRSNRASEAFDPTNLPFDGHHFEQWVADALEKYGWSANTTVGGGDQGIDVLATKNGKTVALQCKLYSQAVGNKAVQEAFAGAAHYSADAAAVITNANYTSSAQQLAITTQVKLLTHHDIPTLYDKVFG